MRAVLLAIFCLAAAGCRVDPNIVLLERENRQLEDRIYQLEDALARAQGSVEPYQAASTSPPSVLQSRESAPPAEPSGPALIAPQEPSPQAPDTGPLQPPAVLLPSDASQPPDRLSIPPRRPIPGDRNGSETPRGTETQQAPPQSRRTRSSATVRMANSTAPAEVVKDNNRIQQITLHPLLTGGYNADGRPGHEGVMALVELRDASGRLLNAAAPISMAVVDKALPGSAARLARWDYSPQEVANQWRKTSAGEGVLLQTLWPGNPPIHSQLRLFVRLTTDDGRKLDAIRDIEVQTPEPATAQWSAASPKELPPPDRPAVPLVQEKPLSAPPATPQPRAAQPPAAELVEADAAPVLELPDEAASSAPRDPPSQAVEKRPAVREAALERPTWSPYRR